MTYVESIWDRIAQKALAGFDASVARDPRLAKSVPLPLVREMFLTAYKAGAEAALRMAREIDGTDN